MKRKDYIQVWRVAQFPEILKTKICNETTVLHQTATRMKECSLRDRLLIMSQGGAPAWFSKKYIVSKLNPPQKFWGKNYTPSPILVPPPPPPKEAIIYIDFLSFLSNISFIFSLVYCLYYCIIIVKILKFSCLCLWMKLLSFLLFEIWHTCRWSS